MKQKFQPIVITENIRFNPKKNTLMWKGFPLQYRIALQFLPEEDYQKLLKYFDMNEDQIVKKFQLT